ncbi:hypothetical protein SVIOM74S_04972 [Streptomyces violarus]
MAARHREWCPTRFHQVRVPAANRVGAEGQGLKIAPHPNTGCLAPLRSQVVPEDRPGVVGGPRGAGQARRAPRGGRLQDLLHRGHHLRTEAGDGPGLSDGRRGPQRHPASKAPSPSSTPPAWTMADELVHICRAVGIETAESSGRPASAASPPSRCCATLPYFRGLDGDHDRPRGRRRPPLGRRRPHRPQKSLGDKARAGSRTRRLLRRVAPEDPGPAPHLLRRVQARGGPLRHLRYVERTSRKLARSTFYAMSRWQGRMESKQGFLGRIVDIGAELFAMSATCVRAELLRSQGATTAARPTSLRPSAVSPGSGSRSLFNRLWTNTCFSTARSSRASCRVRVAGARHRRPVGRGTGADRGRDTGSVREGEPAPADPLTGPQGAHARHAPPRGGCAVLTPRLCNNGAMSDSPAPLADPHLVYLPDRSGRWPEGR